MATIHLKHLVLILVGCLTMALKDQATFEKQLSPYARTLFMRLSSDQKERALEYAECSALSPDDAVAKASSECKKLKK